MKDVGKSKRECMFSALYSYILSYIPMNQTLVLYCSLHFLGALVRYCARWQYTYIIN